MTFSRTLAMMVVVATAAASSSMATDVSAGRTGTRSSALDPILDADLISLGGAPGTATLVSNVSFDPVLDADILANGGKPGSSTYDEDTVFDAILDADILAVSGAFSAHLGSEVQFRRAKSTK
jgi:hypothetical protein